jgi:hypothetical protein
MKHNLQVLKRHLELRPKTIVPYDYLLNMMKELREIDLFKWLEENHPNNGDWANFGANLLATMKLFIDKELLGEA